MKAHAQQALEFLLDRVGYDLGYSEHHAESLADEKRARSQAETRLSSELAELRNQLASLTADLEHLKSIVQTQAPTSAGPSPDVAPGPLAAASRQPIPAAAIEAPLTATEPGQGSSNENSELDVFLPEATQSVSGNILSLQTQADFDLPQTSEPEASSLLGRSLTRVKRLVGHEGAAAPNTAPSPDKPSEPSVARDRLLRFLEQDSQDAAASEGSSPTEQDQPN